MLSISLSQPLKRIARKPRTSVPIIALLALAIGVNTSIFSLVDAVFLKPLPYPESERLVFVWEGSPHIGFPNDTPAPGNYAEWVRQSESFSELAAIRGGTFNLTGEQEPVRVEGRRVTANLFSLMGVNPALGRALSPACDRSGGPAEVVISHRLWLSWFGASMSAIGQTLRLDDQPYEVVGVMPATFRFPTSDTSVWMPASFSAETLSDRRSHYLEVVGRLQDNVTLESAQSEMSEIMRRLEVEYPDTNESVGAGLVPIRTQLAGSVQRPFVLLFAAAACILLIACANVASLLLVHATGRQREMAVRGALGASRSQLIGQLIRENLLLASLGGLAGAALAAGSLSSLQRFVPPELLGTSALTLSPSSFAFVGLLTLATACLFGLTPALYAARTEVGQVLQSSGGRAGMSRNSRTRHLLIVAEVALAFVLLVGAGLFIQTFVRVQQVDPGFDSASVLTMRVDLPGSKYRPAGARDRFYDTALERIRSLPGVQSAGVVTFLPLTRSGGARGFSIEGIPSDSNRDLVANYRLVSDGYFEAMGIRLVAGRPIAPADRADSLASVWINQAMAVKFFDGSPALGKRIKLGNHSEWIQVQGVVDDVHQSGIEVESRAEMYFPYRQVASFTYFNPRDFAIRTSGDPESLATAVREQIRSVDPALPVAEIQSMEAVLDREYSQRRLQVSILTGFAAMALLLATLGIYGLLAHSVVQRTREIGVRMALGARRGEILRTFAQEGLVLAAIGLAIGLVGALAGGRLIADLLYEVSPLHPGTLGACALLLILLSAAASWFPAARATRVDPCVALRRD